MHTPAHHPEERVRQLLDAAFHAWITLGEQLSGLRVSQAEKKAVYEALEQALREFSVNTEAP